MSDAKRSLRGRMGSPDRVQRLVVGVVLMALTVYGLLQNPEWSKWVALAIQFELIATALASWCPLYWSLGAHSCGVR